MTEKAEADTEMDTKQQIQLENLKKELDAHTSSFVDVEDDP